MDVENRTGVDSRASNVHYKSFEYYCLLALFNTKHFNGITYTSIRRWNRYD